MNVKKLIAITTICAALLCSGTYITAAAEDADGITIPESFSVEFALDNVDNYAVGENKYAFSDGNTIYVYSVNTADSSGYDYINGEVTAYEHTSAILALEFSGGNLYFSDGAAYLYSEGAATLAEFTFTTFSDSDKIYDGDFMYYINGSELAVYNMVTYETTPHNGAVYRGLKEINGCFYVLKDAALCVIDDGIVTETSFAYEDYTVGAISTANVSQSLSKKSEIQTANISAGTCIIRVDEDYLGNDTFTVWDWSVTFTDEDMTAQVLYMPDGGNAALIAVGSKTYLTLKSNIKAITYTPSSVSSQSYYLLDSATVYSVPFENEYTKTYEIEKDAVVTVTGYVSGDAFDYDYYKVEYAADGATVSGYVIANLLTPYTFENDVYETNEILDGDQSEDNDIFTAVLVLIIVLLVLIAAGYLTIVITSDKKKNRKKSR